MSRLFLLLHSLIGPSLAGAFVIVALTFGLVEARPIILAAAAGFAAGLPIALYLSRRLGG
jgi:hypothetical protein